MKKFFVVILILIILIIPSFSVSAIGGLTPSGGGEAGETEDNSFFDSFFSFINSVITNVFTENSPFGILFGAVFILFLSACVMRLGGFLK